MLKAVNTMVIVFLADGFEEIEAIATVDILRRCGIDVKTVSVTSSKNVTGSHGITVLADETAEKADLNDFDAVVLPGGMPGTENLQENRTVSNTLVLGAQRGKLLCAICAAPKVLGALDLLIGLTAVCFPSFESELKGANVSSKSVMRDGNIITARGAGVAHDFAFSIAEALGRLDEAAHVRSSMLYEN